MRSRQAQPRPKGRPDRARLRTRTRELRRLIGRFDYLASGTLTQRMKVCGKPNCRCASDPDARHGPYYEWGYMHDGKLVHRVVPPERAELMQHAIDNYKRVRELLHEWELQSADEIIAPEPNED
jgi:hypothetical protein